MNSPDRLAATKLWAFAYLAAATLQWVSVPRNLEPDLLCRVLCGVSVAGLLVPCVAILPLALTLRNRPGLGRPQRPPLDRGLLWIALAWAGWCMISAGSALAGVHVWTGIRAVGELLLIGISFLGAVLWLRSLDPHRRGAALATGLFAGTCLLAAFAVLEMALPRLELFSIVRSEASRSIFPRVAGITVWPNVLGLILAVGVALGWGLRGRWVLAGQGLLLIGLAGSGSRNGWLVLVVAAALCWVLRISRRRVLAQLVLFAVIATCIPVSARQLGLDGPFLPSLSSWLPRHALSAEQSARLEREVPEFGSSVGDPRETAAGRSLGQRREIWQAALESIARRPLLGIGVGAFEETVGSELGQGFNAHSLPLNLAAETGVFGVGVILLFGIAFLLHGLERARRLDPRAPPPIFDPRIWWLVQLLFLAGQLLDCLTYDTSVIALWTLTAAGAAVDGLARYTVARDH